MKSLRLLGAVAAIGSLVLLSGCSAGGRAASLPEAAPSAGGPAEAPGDAAGGYAEKAPDAPSGIPGVNTAQLVARTARVSLTVTDVETAAAELRRLAQSLGGQVTAENLVTTTGAKGESGLVSTIVVSVPGDRLDSALVQLKSVGTLTSREVTSEDVSLEVADVDSRIKTLDDSIGRLRDLWKRAGTVRELTELEGEIRERVAERDSLAAQQKVLARRVAQSPITIELSQAEAVAQPTTTGFLEGLLAGWNALVAGSRTVLMVVGALLPFAVLVAVVAIPVVVWRRRSRRVPAAPPASPPTPPGTAAGEDAQQAG